MRTVIYLLNIFVLFCGSANSHVYTAKTFGHVVPEWYVFKNYKDKMATMLGKKGAFKGLQALRANDFANAVKKAKVKLKQDKEQKIKSLPTNKLNNEYFVVARVADEVITNVDITNAIRFVFFSSGKKFDKKYARMMVRPILDALIEDKIRQRLARLNGVNIGEEVNKKIEEIAKNNKLTVEELGSEFTKAGIDMIIFKRNIASKLVFSGFFQSMANLATATTSAIEDEKRKYKKMIKGTRYKISEIFFKADSIGDLQVAKDRAAAVVDLLNDGFNFSALADSISQRDTGTKTSEPEWIQAENLEPSIYNAIRTLNAGTHSGIIQVRGGYEIVQVIDKAEPNKEGISKSKYRVVAAEIPTPTPRTEEEATSFEMSINTIAEADSVDVFKRACEVYGFKMIETTVTNPDAVQRELITRNKSTGKSGIIRVSENEPLVALFVVSEEIPDAILPNDKFFSDMIINRKATQEFVKIMKRHRLMNYVEIYTKKLDQVICD